MKQRRCPPSSLATIDHISSRAFIIDIETINSILLQIITDEFSKSKINQVLLKSNYLSDGNSYYLSIYKSFITRGPETSPAIK